MLAGWGWLDKRNALAAGGAARCCSRPDRLCGAVGALAKSAHPDAAQSSAACAARQRQRHLSSRFGIWSNAVALIANTLAQRRLGNFSFAWTLTPFRIGRWPSSIHARPAAGSPNRARTAARAARAGAASVARSGWPGSALAGAEPRRLHRSRSAAFMIVLMMAVRKPVQVPAVVRLLPVTDGLRVRRIACGGEAPAAAASGAQ